MTENLCEICDLQVIAGQAHVRVGADAMIWDGDQEYDSLTNGRSMIFSVFHSSCVMNTMDDPEYNDMPYVWEARSLVNAAHVCDSCKHPEPKQQVTPFRLSLLQGGR